MRICIVGSMRDFERMQEIAGELRQRGHRIVLPIDTSEGRLGGRAAAKSDFMKGMFENIKQCDAVLAVNDVPRGGVEGYIGPNTFLQLGIAMALEKPLFALKKWNERLPYKDELDAMGINLLDIKLPF